MMRREDGTKQRRERGHNKKNSKRSDGEIWNLGRRNEDRGRGKMGNESGRSKRREN